MKSLNYYKNQLEYFTELREKCTNKETLKKLNRAVSKYQSLIDNFDSMDQLEECHCSLCAMQG